MTTKSIATHPQQTGNPTAAPNIGSNTTTSKQNSLSNKNKSEKNKANHKTLPKEYKGPNPTNIGTENNKQGSSSHRKTENVESCSSDSSDSETGDANGLRFFKRVYGLPVVRESIGKLRSYIHENDASYVKYAKFAVEKAEGVFYSVTHITQPYHDKITAPLNVMDNIGCKSLDFIESKFPVVKQNPQEVLTSSRSAIDSYKESINKNISSAIKTPSKMMHKADDNISSLIDNILHYVDEKHEQPVSVNQDSKKQNDNYTSINKINTLLVTLSHNVYNIGISVFSSAKSAVASLDGDSLASVYESLQTKKTDVYEKSQEVYSNLRSKWTSGIESTNVYFEDFMSSDNIKAINQKVTDVMMNLGIFEKFTHLKDQIIKTFTSSLNKQQNQGNETHTD